MQYLSTVVWRARLLAVALHLCSMLCAAGAFTAKCAPPADLAILLMPLLMPNTQPHAQQPDSARLRIVQRNGSLQTYQLGTWEMLGVWLLGVFILLVFVPRWILRFKRRLKAHSKHFE